MSKLRARKITQLRRVEANRDIQAKALAALQPHSSRVLAEMRLDTKASDKFGEIFMQQPDLLYVEAVLVSEGINDNDDAFTHEELWRAQGTPILKPINIGHNDRSIVGVMYGVEARKIEDGSVMTEDDGSPFELVMHGVIWHYLPHICNTASSLVEKFAAGEAYVSMECWFEGYNYGFYDHNGNFKEEMERCDDTAFLERNLRACGGSGEFKGDRIGRALTGITFGGVGIVEVPANRRSIMTDIFLFDVGAMNDSVSASEELASVATEKDDSDNVVRNTEESYMNDTTQKAVANAKPADVAEEVKKGVTVALSDRDRAEAARRAQAELESAKAEVAELRGELEASEQARKSVEDAVDEQFEALRVEAGAAGDTPAEIKKIDDAVRRGGSGAEVMQAKIAWIANSRSAASAALSDENKTLKAENEELRAKVREASRTEEIQEVFANLLSDEELTATVARGLAKSDEDYAEWLDEKKLLAKKMVDFMDPKKKEEMKKKDKGKAGNVVRRDDGGEVLQDHGVSLQPGHGRVPSSVPSPKTLASVDDIGDLFEEVDEGDLAGASAGADEGDEPRKNPYEDIVTAMLSETRQERRPVGNNEGGN